jgi:hypothetical protein
MRTTLQQTLRLFLIVAVGVFLTACDDSPSSVQDFDIQPDVQFSTNSVTLIVSGDLEGSNRSQVTVSYQGLNEHPQAQASGEVGVEKVTETGDPQEGGEQTWEIAYDQSVDGVIQEQVDFTAPSATGDVSGSVTVTVSAITIQSDFSPTFAAIADYEDAQRDSSANGNTEISLSTDTVSPNSNGAQSLQVDGTPGGSVSFTRRASLPGLDRFSFLVRQNPNSSFTLTVTFNEEVDGNQVARQVEIPVPSGSSWLKYIIEFDQISEDFNPVATRAGGNGPLTEIEFSADADVTYYLDELFFGDAQGAKVEIMDFERTSTAYVSDAFTEFGSSDDVAAESDGPTSQSIEGATSFFGYNYNGLKLDVDGNDVVSFRAKATEGDELYVFVESAQFGGGFEFGSGQQVALPVGSWGTVEIPLSELGNDPSVLLSEGISNVGFETRGSDIDVLLDDVKIISKE